MKIEIKVHNGSGWNNYAGLRTLKLRRGTRGLARENGVFEIAVGPADSERPYGIAARYYDQSGDCVFTQGFDQNDSAAWIEDRINWLLSEGIAVRQARLNRARALDAYKHRVSAWRRNFDPAPKSHRAENALRSKIGAWRSSTGRFSRSDCWSFTHAIRSGEMTFRQVHALFHRAV